MKPERDPREAVEEARRRMDATAAAQLARRGIRATRRSLLTPEARRARDFLLEQLRELDLDGRIS